VRRNAEIGFVTPSFVDFLDVRARRDFKAEQRGLQVGIELRADDIDAGVIAVVVQRDDPRDVIGFWGDKRRISETFNVPSIGFILSS